MHTTTVLKKRTKNSIESLQKRSTTRRTKTQFHAGIFISASNLPDVRQHFKMKVYANVSFNGNSKTEKKTPADKENETNPAWNHNMGYTIAETGMQYQSLMLLIKLYSKRKLGDRYIGEVHTSMEDIFDKASDQGFSDNLSIQLKKGSDPIQDAMLNLSYRFGETIEKEKPSFWKQALRSGVVIVFRVVMVATIGTDVEVPIFKESDTVGGDAP